MNKEQMAEQAFYAQLSYKGSHKDSFVKGYTMALENQEKRVSRQLTLLLAARDILTKCQNSPCVEDVMSVTAIWDDAECDGYCLLNEINDLITEKP